IWFLRGTPSAMGLLLGMTVKNLERVAYFAAYVIKSVDTEKRDQLLMDREAEFNAAREAIRIRYEQEAQKEEANVKALAEMRTKEMNGLTEEFERFRQQLSMLEKQALISESEY